MLEYLLKDSKLNDKKITRELELAIERDYVKKFWINYKRFGNENIIFLI